MKIMLSFLVLICASCIQQHSKTPPNVSSVVVQEVTNQEDNPQLAGLEDYVKGTILTAVLTDIRIQTKKSETEDTHSIKAKIAQLIKGKADENIEFEMVTESGEAVTFDETILICLCQQEGLWYWAGAGSVFPGDDIFIAKAKEIALEAGGQSEAVFCD